MRYKKLFIRIAYVVVPFGCIGVFMKVDGNTFQKFSPSSLQPISSDTAIIRLKMNRVQLGNSGLSLSSPNKFDSLAKKTAVLPVAQSTDSELQQSESFQYESNGVIIKVDYLTYANDTRISLEKIREQYEKDFGQLHKEKNVKYSFNDIQRSGVEGLLVNADYPVQHLHKTQRYEVLTFVLQNQVWRVTANYKDCDQKGQALVKWMLQSIQIST